MLVSKYNLARTFYEVIPRGVGVYGPLDRDDAAGIESTTNEIPVWHSLCRYGKEKHIIT